MDLSLVWNKLYFWLAIIFRQASKKEGTVFSSQKFNNSFGILG